ncbi:MAG TPA: RNA polymerase sigma factor [Gemmatimonadaceae bacterium]|nr:RNA polymerase sigma factor [Gemmatimonadaceae bacterium]
MSEATLQADESGDGALIARWQGGDERAATQLVERYASSLARFVASLGEPEVEEVVQDTFVRAFGSLDAFRAESSLKTWLFTIARNLVRDRGRQARRDRLAVPVAEEHAVSEHDALDGVIADETEDRVRDAVTRLTRMQREVFTLRVAEGLSYKEIATVVGSTEGAARVHYHHAMRAIKELLDE